VIVTYHGHCLSDSHVCRLKPEIRFKLACVTKHNNI